MYSTVGFELNSLTLGLSCLLDVKQDCGVGDNTNREEDSASEPFIPEALS